MLSKEEIMRYVLCKQKLCLSILMLIASFIGVNVVLAQEAKAPVFPVKHLAILHAKDREPIVRPKTQPQFEVRGISQDGKFLFIQSEELKTYFDISYSLQAVNLRDGRISTVAQFGTVGSFAWHEQTGETESRKAIEHTASIAVKKDAKAPDVRIEAPMQQAPPNDPLQSVNPNGFRGQLVYNATVVINEPKPHWEPFLVIRNVYRDAQAQSSTVTYPIKSLSSVGFPQFSPDGQRVLLKVGQFGDRYNQHYLYLWQPKSGELRQGPVEHTSYLLSYWSPDSKHIAYITGADASGDLFGTLPMQLHVYNLLADKSRVVARGIDMTDHSWSHRGTILYAAKPELKKVTGGSQAQQPVHPNIYEVSAEGGDPKLVIPNAYTPKASPDNNWIAYLGWPDTQPEKEQPKANRPGLYLFNRKNNQRLLVKADLRRASLHWTPDSKRLVVVETQYNGKTAQGEARVGVVSVG